MPRICLLLLFTLAPACRLAHGPLAEPSICPTTPAHGHLLIMGGAIKPDNEDIYSHFMAPLPPDAVIGIIPTASASPADAAQSAAATLRRYAGDRRIEPLDISLANTATASDPKFIEQLSHCNALYFTGGDQSRITAVFRPATGDTPALAAMNTVLERAGVIGGSSAGAAMMSDPMLTGGRSDDALLGKSRANGDDSGFGLGKGMGFFTQGLTDQHFLRRGRLGRLIAALELSGFQYGYGVDENSAIDVDLEASTITALGPGPAAVIVDISEMDRRGPARRNVRISLLQSGDVVRLDNHRVLPGAPRLSGPDAPANTPAAGADLPDAWSPGAVTLALCRLSRGRNTPVELHSPAFDLRFSADSKTAFYTEHSDPERATIVGVRLDITPRAAPRK